MRPAEVEVYSIEVRELGGSARVTAADTPEKE